MTREQILARFPRATESFISANLLTQLPEAGNAAVSLYRLGEPLVVAKPKKTRLRQNKKPLLNALETRFLAVLEHEYPKDRIRAQAKRYKLANGIWYKPDFTIHNGSNEVAFEVKGPHAFRGGFENLKFAAHEWPEIEWWLVWEEEPKSGNFTRQRIIP